MSGDIAIIGTGNVATHLARALGERVLVVAGRSIDKAEALAAEIGAEACEYGALSGYSPRFAIVSVADKVVADVAEQCGRLNGDAIAVHTSGTVLKESLLPMSERVGVLYPLQSFSKDAELDLSEVPFFNEATDEETLKQIDDIAHTLSRRVHHADATARGKLHVAGVFASNFPNIMLLVVEDILAKAGYPLDTVEPLVNATVRKAFDLGPRQAQTGPARRGDEAVMQRHCELLPEDQRQVYELLSQYIAKQYK